ncbi:MAG: NAD(P)/FAD-dependent oxidoreductase, partial [Candidatus Omnitrophica bacterium]|nr:NAD(P)/FAD-dependent oxidoreductase [Candidatus Omnitrophota bacterium]
TFLDEHGVSPALTFIDIKEFGRVVYPEHDFVIRYGFDDLKKWLIETFPQEKDGLEVFFHQINRFYRQLDHFSNAKLPLWFKLAVSLVLYPQIVKTSCMTLEQYMTKKIKDKKARAILGSIWGFVGLPPQELSSFYYLIILRGCWFESTMFVKGGYSRLFSAMVERIRECGSQVIYSRTVTKIITDCGRRVIGVVTDKGEEVKARVIISNANSIDTLTKLIDDDTRKADYAKKLKQMEKSLSAVTVYLGLSVPAKEIGMQQPLLSIHPSYDHTAGYQHSRAGDAEELPMAVVDHSQFDPDLAPAGKSTLCAMVFAEYKQWEGLSQEAYDRKKSEAARRIVRQLERYLPGLSNHIECIEVATPKTMERYPMLPEGAIYGFAETVPQSSINRLPQTTKIKGLFLTGAWTTPGCGVHGCFVSGFDAADLAERDLR